MNVFLSLSIEEAEVIRTMLESRVAAEYQEIDNNATERMKAAVKLLCKVYDAEELAQIVNS